MELTPKQTCLYTVSDEKDTISTFNKADNCELCLFLWIICSMAPGQTATGAQGGLGKLIYQ
jgi:hypothetical protein